MKKFFLILISILISVFVLQACVSNENVSGMDITDSELVVNYIDVGQADSIFIKTPEGKNMLIDAGETKKGAVVDFLNKNNVKKIDAVIATHPHSDHISEMDSVIENYEITNFYMPKVMHTTKSFENMIDALESKNVNVIEAKAGVTIDIDKNLKCDILAPCKNNYEDLNDWSAVLKITYGENSFLFTGDATEISERDIINNKSDIKADVLKIGHHGSRTSTSDEFLEFVNPKYTVISAEEGNDYGHPHKETMERLKDINTYITFNTGTVTAISDGKNINIKTEKENNNNKENNLNDNTENLNLSYIGNGKSKKYHKSDCSSLPGKKNQVILNSKSEAESMGYTPCGVCRP